MILGLGIDICEVKRIKGLIDRYGERFLKRVYTEEELRKKTVESLSARFAAKEATIKALGGYFINSLKEISVINTEEGKPKIELRGKALRRFCELGGKSIYLSLSHTKEIACAVVIIEG